MCGLAVRSLLTISAMVAMCGRGSDGEDRVPAGPWGGEGVGLVVRETGADVVLDCAHGEITVPLRLERDGSFSLPGYYVLDAGPVVEGAPENRRPATYFGSVDERRLMLSFTLPDENHTEGPFTAILGGPAQVRTCR